MIRALFVSGMMMAALAAGQAASEEPRIVIAGDSTAASYPPDRAPQTGWGQALPYYLHGATVDNRAASGRSARSFVSEGKWAALLEALQPGDVVLISFGHNDQRDDAPERYSEANTDFRDFLKGFVADVRAKEARPVIVSSAARRLWEGPAMVETHGLYRWNAQLAAEETGADYIDLANLSLSYFEGLGPEETKSDFLWLSPADGNARFPGGVEDNTHFTALGACGVAHVLSKALYGQGILEEPDRRPLSKQPLRPYVVTECAKDMEWIPAE